MGKPTGFMEIARKTGAQIPPEQRLGNYQPFHIPLSRQQQQQQGARCMACGVPFCQSGMMMGGMASGCPLNNLIPEWNDLIYRGKWELAYRRLRRTNNFPEFTARVCPALCEAACTCSLGGEAVAVKENEYGVIETAFASGWVKPCPPAVRTGKRVAVVGSGPSGLAAADQLNRRGHRVTVYERSDRIGGLLMYGIPNMKLDKSVVARREALMRAEGVEFVTGADVGRGQSGQEILEGYDAVVLCCGASQPRDIAVPGRESAGIHFAVDYLSGVTKGLLEGAGPGPIDARDKNVLVIGGGDTGNDCVGTALRQGCRSVVQLEMMPQPPASRAEANPWPQWPRVLKTDYGQQEAIARFGRDPRLYQTTVREFVADEAGRLRQVVVDRLGAKRDEQTGRIAMIPIPDAAFTLEADLALIAAGFVGAQPYVAQAFGLERDDRGNLAAGADHATAAPKVFAAGDARRGQSLVVWAIREGREAARAVDTYLMGYSNL